MTKQCNLCHLDKRLDEFSRAKDGKQGRRARCKRCQHNAVQAKRLEQREAGQICIVDGCERELHVGALCVPHYRRQTRYGDPLAGSPIRRVKGSGTITTQGYKVLTSNGVLRLEHRIVMERVLGRPLRSNETVHHMNGDRLDNRPDNLELWASRHPNGSRVRDLLAFAKEILADYAAFDDVLTGESD